MLIITPLAATNARAQAHGLRKHARRSPEATSTPVPTARAPRRCRPCRHSQRRVARGSARRRRAAYASPVARAPPARFGSSGRRCEAESSHIRSSTSLPAHRRLLSFASLRPCVLASLPWQPRASALELVEGMGVRARATCAAPSSCFHQHPTQALHQDPRTSFRNIWPHSFCRNSHTSVLFRAPVSPERDASNTPPVRRAGLCPSTGCMPAGQPLAFCMRHG